MNLVDRFRYVMKVYNETPSSFADKIGVQRSSISHILSERNKPSLDFIQKILEYYPKIDAQWLINGKQSTNENKVVSEGSQEPKSKEVETVSSKEDDEIDQTTEPDAANLEEIHQIEQLGKSNSAKKVERIVIFYSDNTFKSFNPES